LFFWLDPKEPKGQDAAKLPPALPTRPPLLRQPTALVSSLLLGGCSEIFLAFQLLENRAFVFLSIRENRVLPIIGCLMTSGESENKIFGKK
jgi:hypothetical protein